MRFSLSEDGGEGKKKERMMGSRTRDSGSFAQSSGGTRVDQQLIIGSVM